MSTEILVLYYSRNGTTEALAREVVAGVENTAGFVARLRTVPPVSADTDATLPSIPDSGPPYASNDDLRTELWFAGALVGKPAGLFTSTGSLHGGQETTLMSMAIPLLHHGMLIAGLPYSVPELTTTRTGGTPYGASHVSFNRDNDALSEEEKVLAGALGARVAGIAKKLA